MKRSLSLVPGLVVLLAGCGGGGDSGGSGSGGIRPEAPEYLVSAQAARRFGGLSASPLTSAQVDATEDAVLARADWLLLTDVLFLNGNAETIDDLYHYQTVECPDGTCYYAETATRGIGQRTIRHVIADERDSNEQVMPVGQRHGITLAQAVESGQIAPGERYEAAEYGGWLEYSAFAITGVAYLGGDFDGWGYVQGMSYGQAAPSNPTGNATWTGIVVGTDNSETEAIGNTIQGQARIDFALGNEFQFPRVDIAFTQMYDIDAGTRWSDMHWYSVTVEDGSFSTTQIGAGSIEGRFYGPNHEEVGGVFQKVGNYVGRGVTGAFGATRD